MGQFGRGVIAFLPDLKYLVKKNQIDKMIEINLLLSNITHPKQIVEKIENQQVSVLY